MNRTSSPALCLRSSILKVFIQKSTKIRKNWKVNIEQYRSTLNFMITRYCFYKIIITRSEAI